MYVVTCLLSLALQRSAMFVAKRCRPLLLQRRSNERIVSAIEMLHVNIYNNW
jgi:hypothetical protein